MGQPLARHRRRCCPAASQDGVGWWAGARWQCQRAPVAGLAQSPGSVAWWVQAHRLLAAAAATQKALLQLPLPPMRPLLRQLPLLLRPQLLRRRRQPAARPPLPLASRQPAPPLLQAAHPCPAVPAAPAVLHHPAADPGLRQLPAALSAALAAPAPQALPALGRPLLRSLGSAGSAAAAFGAASPQAAQQPPRRPPACRAWQREGWLVPRCLALPPLMLWSQPGPAVLLAACQPPPPPVACLRQPKAAPTELAGAPSGWCRWCPAHPAVTGQLRGPAAGPPAQAWCRWLLTLLHLRRPAGWPAVQDLVPAALLPVRPARPQAAPPRPPAAAGWRRRRCTACVACRSATAGWSAPEWRPHRGTPARQRGRLG